MKQTDIKTALIALMAFVIIGAIIALIIFAIASQF